MLATVTPRKKQLNSRLKSFKKWNTHLDKPETLRRQNNPVAPEGYLDMEHIWRRSAAETIREYLENCSLGGFRYLVDSARNRLEKCAWVVLIACALLGLGYVLHEMREKSATKPVLVSLESTRHHISRVAFPAVAICNVNRISRRAAETYTKLLWSRDNATYSRAELSRLVLMLGRLHDHDVEGYEQLISFEGFLHRVDGPFDVDSRLLELSPSCEETFERCNWREQIRNCSELFLTKKTQNGYCCVFNYHANVAEKLGVEKSEHEDKIRTVPTAGFYYGLSAILNPQLHDYAYPLHSSTGFDVLIFDPYDYPDQTGGGLVHRRLSPASETFLNLRASTVYSTPDVKRFSIAERGCRFNDEVSGAFHGHYSYSNCIVRCRIRALARLCECAPFFLPSGDVPSCTLENIPCLNKYKQKMMFLFPPLEMDGLEVEREDSLLCPECAPDCTAVRYAVTTSSTDDGLHTESGYRFGILDGLNVTERSMLHVYYGNVESDLYKMDVLFYWFETTSNFGGLGGFFIGFSLISVVELNYFLTIRFVAILRTNKRKYGLYRRKTWNDRFI